MATETTIKTLVGNEYQGKTNYTVTLADGTVGYLQKESDDDLKEGDAVIAEYKPYKSKAGKESILITLKRPQYASPQPQAQPPRPTINVGAGKSKEEMKAEASIRIACELTRAFGEGKLESAQVSVSVKEFGRLLWSEIDDCYTK